MQEQNLILDKLTEIANKLDEQNILQKTVLNLSEAAKYLDISESHLYKLTSTRQKALLPQRRIGPVVTAQSSIIHR
jgi:hypothetical protein